ncbi:NADP-specific glutamate dehydrogenase [Hasllibacter sp. MH4015]|uniref:NADP-specific glutamate dehydrogenase n=1 Tax=Hasllibacter sp. MH4015 TaxID=2854029 RepID=UPI001CD81988|nr:NADP-specific glutamate dehydrogenase [Hasllibacter sp. MH4015]
MSDRQQLVDTIMEEVTAGAAGQEEFLQAVRDVAEDVLTVEKADAGYAAARVLAQVTVPDRIIEFRVPWMDDSGAVRINRGWRVQTSNAIGPYKGGIRFHPSVTPSVLKFLGFEQVFKNALTGLPLGGGKGGSDFDPKGCSDTEIMRFCHAFMAELVKYIGPDHDIPAGDIGVGTREIGYLFGAYKRHRGQFHGALTGKGEAFGGSAMRVEATGYGLIYFVSCMLGQKGRALEDQRIAISGMGNVAVHAAEKAICEGATVVTLSDTSGTVVAEDGLDLEMLERLRTQKDAEGDLASVSLPKGVTFREGAVPWGVEADIALPCATQNEMSGDHVDAAIDAGVGLIAEGANMPLTKEAAEKVGASDVLYAPGKASNAGGVAISGLEMSQNAHGRSMTSDNVDEALKEIMQSIHRTIIDEVGGGDRPDYKRGANVAGYRKVAKAVAAFGPI